MKALTARQAEILNFIRQAVAVRGIPPTIAEIASAMGVQSANAIRDHLKALEHKGALELIPSTARGIRLAAEISAKVQGGLPIIGRVAAGSPILAEQHIEAYCQLGPELFQPRADYLLRVRGMSMRDAGILDGDLLAVHRTTEAHTRQIVVARLEDEVTVKRLRIVGHIARLEPANPEFPPIKVNLRRAELCLEGVGVGIIRNRGL
jgi:repressor LexA